VWQTELASSLVNFWTQYKIVLIAWLIDWLSRNWLTLYTVVIPTKVKSMSLCRHSSRYSSIAAPLPAGADHEICAMWGDLQSTVGEAGASGTFGLVDMSTESDHGPSCNKPHCDLPTRATGNTSHRIGIRGTYCNVRCDPNSADTFKFYV